MHEDKKLGTMDFKICAADINHIGIAWKLEVVLLSVDRSSPRLSQYSVIFLVE